MTVEVTEDLLNATFIGAMEWLHDNTSPESMQYLSDDGLDYLNAAIEFGKLMFDIHLDGDIARLQAIFDAPGLFLAFYGEVPPCVSELAIPANLDTDYEGELSPEEIR